MSAILISAFLVSCGEGSDDADQDFVDALSTKSYEPATVVQSKNLKRLQPSITLRYTYNGKEFTDTITFESDPTAQNDKYIKAMIFGTSSFSSTLVMGCFNASEALDFVEYDFMCLGSKVSNHADAYLFNIDAEGSIEGSYAYAPASDATLKVVENPDSFITGKVNF